MEFRRMENRAPEGKKQEDFGRMPGFAEFMGERIKDVNKANLLK